MPVMDLFELTESEGPATASVNVEDGKLVRQYETSQPSSTNDLIDTLHYLVGGVGTDINLDGRLQRTLPVADPYFVSWFVRSVDNIRGVGQPSKQPSLFAQEAPTLPYFASYPQFKLGITFGPRPFPVIPDEQVPIYSSNPITGNQLLWTFPDGAQSNFRYAAEWLRFTQFTFQAQDNWITATQGQNTMQTANPFIQPSGLPFPGMPRMYLPDSLLTFEWHIVPFRYVTSKNSYLKSLRAHVNQFDFWPSQDTPGRFLFDRGSLLYLTFEVSAYTPPIQGLAQWSPNIQTAPKLCNLKLHFLHTTRKAFIPPSPTNPNYIVDGNNALPWLNTRKFYYTTANPDFNSAPQFFSAPFEMLWTDPDATFSPAYP